MNPVLRLAGVSCRRDGRVLLDHVTLSVRAQEAVVVEGPRGAGKTTLLAVAAGILRPDRGAVFIGERDVASLQRSSLPFVRRNVGFLPPDSPLVRHETALENVMLALAVRGDGVAEAEGHARRALEALGLERLQGEVVGHLSEGERRLVALARALAGSPAVVVLDEPSAGLGPTDRDRVVAAIQGALSTGAAVLCGAADEAFAAAMVTSGAERVRLEEGRLVTGLPRIALVVDEEAVPHEAPTLSVVRTVKPESEAELSEDDLQEVDEADGGRS